MSREVLAVGFAPGKRHAAAHAHRLQHLGIAPAGLGQGQARDRVARRLLGRLARQAVGQHSDRDQQHRAGQRRHADPEMEQEADAEIERHPRQVEQRRRPARREEGAHQIEVAQRLQPVAAAPCPQGKADDRVVDAQAERLVERLADAHQDAAAHQLEDALEGVEHRGEDGEAHQSRHAAARQHPVIDLEHEERAGQHQHVAHAGEEPDAEEGAAAGGERRRQLGARRGEAERVVPRGSLGLDAGHRSFTKVRASDREVVSALFGGARCVKRS